MPDLPHILNTADFYSLSLVQVGDGWQANLQEARGSAWRIRVGVSPVEALLELFAAYEVVCAPDLPPAPPPPY